MQQYCETMCREVVLEIYKVQKKNKSHLTVKDCEKLQISVSLCQDFLSFNRFSITKQGKSCRTETNTRNMK